MRISNVGNGSELQSPLSNLSLTEHAHHNSSSLILLIKVVESDLVHYWRLVVDQALELRIAQGLVCPVLRAEDVSTTVLLTLLTEAGPVSKVNIEVEVVLIVSVLEGEVVAALRIITIESQIIELILQEDNLINLTLDFKIT